MFFSISSHGDILSGREISLAIDIYQCLDNWLSSAAISFHGTFSQKCLDTFFLSRKFSGFIFQTRIYLFLVQSPIIPFLLHSCSFYAQFSAHSFAFYAHFYAHFVLLLCSFPAHSCSFYAQFSAHSCAFYAQFSQTFLFHAHFKYAHFLVLIDIWIGTQPTNHVLIFQCPPNIRPDKNCQIKNCQLGLSTRPSIASSSAQMNSERLTLQPSILRTSIRGFQDSSRTETFFHQTIQTYVLQHYGICNTNSSNVHSSLRGLVSKKYSLHYITSHHITCSHVVIHRKHLFTREWLNVIKIST